MFYFFHYHIEKFFKIKITFPLIFSNLSIRKQKEGFFSSFFIVLKNMKSVVRERAREIFSVILKTGTY